MRVVKRYATVPEHRVDILKTEQKRVYSEPVEFFDGFGCPFERRADQNDYARLAFYLFFVGIHLHGNALATRNREYSVQNKPHTAVLCVIFFDENSYHTFILTHFVK